MMNIASFVKLHNLNSKQRKDCILINEVKRYSFLYDRSEMNHKRSKYRQAAWEEIGQKLGMEGIDCMNRWKVIRDRYRKEKRDKFRGPRSARTKRWLYYDLCTFLDPHLEDVKPFSQELDEVMNEESVSGGESSQDCQQMRDERDSSTEEQQTSLNVSSASSKNVSSALDTSASFSIAPLHGSSTPSTSLMPPSTYIRILMPPDQPQETNPKKPSTKTKKSSTTASPSKSSPRKYVKILPKTEMPSPRRSSRNGRVLDDDDSVDLSMYKDKKDLDTIDHLMNFMGNTLKQMPSRKQNKICQELTAVFFNIITNEEEEEDDS